ncbi:MAG TPA: HlyD family secretion protein [Alphaproteobacteria bacterium]|nr:HlyD family secretion protein [Alphaproteobacteria bacterium]
MARPQEAAPLAKIAPAERIPGLREPPVQPRRRSRVNRRVIARLVLLLLGPLVLLAVGLYAYLAGGRFVSTDDAYVKADNIQVSADIAGRVVAVPVVENQRVKAGDVLFRIDDAPYRIALEGAKARLAGARNEIEALKASYRQKLADIAKAQDTVAYYQHNVERNRGLNGQGVVSAQNLEDSQHNLNTAQQSLAADKQDLARVVAALGGNPDLPAEQQAGYLQAKAAVDKAELDLGYCVVHAPVAGIVSNVTLREGDYLHVGDSTFALIPSDRLWITANFKETQLTHVQHGQPATITVDTYPGRTWRAQVESVAPASGAEFALLPPQNASGNWVKVVQRIPVRLEVKGYDEAPVLRSGMSVDAEIDTGHRRNLRELWSDLRDLVGL